MRTLIVLDGDVDVRIGDDIELHCGTHMVKGVTKETLLETDTLTEEALLALLDALPVVREKKLKPSGA